MLAGALLLAAGLSAWLLRELAADLPTELAPVVDYAPPRASQVLSADGEVIGEFFVERRVPVPIDQIPPAVRLAFLAAEDQRFYEHGGIDYQGILRAAWANLRAGAVVQGGSTITQQVAKLLLLGPERSLARKLREALLARRIEARLSKDEILSVYLNQVYLGHGAYGIGAAAAAYFGKEVSALSAGEAAMLAAMPKAPGRATPFRDFARARARQRYVLDQMRELGWLGAAERDAALAEPLVLVGRGRTLRNVAAPYFVEEVRKQLAQRFSEEELEHDGLRIHTTLDMRLQRAAEAAVRAGLESLEARLGFSGPIAALSGERLAAFLTGPARPLGPDSLRADGTLASDSVDDPERAGHFLTALSSGEEAPPPDAADRGELDAATLDATRPGAVLSERAARRLAGAAAARQRASTAPPRFVPETPHAAVVLTLSPEVVVGSGALRAELVPDSARRLLSWSDARGRRIRPGDVVPVTFASADADAASPAARRGRVPPRPRATLLERPSVQGALVALSPRTGAIRAMVGGYDFEASQFNRATQARRQIGSTIKPFIYAAALEGGLTPLTIRWDVPVKFRTSSGVWAPRNYRPEYLGRITLRTALERSINTVAAQLTAEIGTPRLIELLRRAGVRSALPAALSLSLGTADLSPLELGAAMAAFPAGGVRVRPVSVLRVLDGQRNLLMQHEPAPDAEGAAERVTSAETAYVLVDMLKAVAETGTARGARELGRPVAGKTGTSTGFRDAWFVGFSPELLCVVWVGRDDFAPIGHDVTGGRAALPIWTAFMRQALAGTPVRDFTPAPGTLFVRADPSTGALAPPGARGSRLVPIVRGTLGAVLPGATGPAAGHFGEPEF